MKISNFNNFIYESNTPELKVGSQITIEFTDKKGKHIVGCELCDFGWGLDRKKIHQQFRIVSSKSSRYPVGSELILAMDFNNTEDRFIIYPYYNEEKSIRRMERKFYRAFIRIID